MDMSQIAYAVALLVSTCFACRDNRASYWPLVLAMWFNFGATFLLAFDARAVLVADVLAASFLVMRGRREGAVALLFVLMMPVYLVADNFGWSPAVTYTIVDVLAYLQLLIMGWPENGLRHHVPSRSGRRTDHISLVSSRDNIGDPARRSAGEAQ